MRNGPVPDGQVDLVHICFGGLGGHAAVIQPLTVELARRGVRSTVCLYAPAKELATSAPWSLIHETVSVPKGSRADLGGLARIANLVRTARPRVVLCHTQAPVAAAAVGQLFGGVTPRIILVEHQAIGLRSTANQVKSLAALPLSRGVIVLTQDYAHRYPFRKLPLKAVRHMAVVPNGVDLDVFRPAPTGLDAQDARDPAPFVVGTMSRLTATKDITTLIKAQVSAGSSCNRPVLLRIAGDGPERLRLEQLVAHLGLDRSVEFCGTLDEPGVVRFLHGLDVYVQPTLGETLSTAILQAYAVGLPVVASDVEGVRNLVRDTEDGLLVPGQDPDKLAQILTRLEGDPSLRVALGEAARARAEAEFSAALMADRYLDAIASVDPGGPWRAWTRSSGRGQDSPHPGAGSSDDGGRRESPAPARSGRDSGSEASTRVHGVSAKTRVTNLARSAGVYWPLQGLRPAARRSRRKRTAFYSQFVGHGDLAFDIGANIGNRVEAFLGAGARVIAVEPQPWCIEQLRHRFARQGRVRIIPRGAGSVEGSATLHLADTHSIASMSPAWMEATSAAHRFDSGSWTGTIEVPITTLDALIELYGCPRFCKIDVEGFELAVIGGLSTAVPAVSFEFTPETLDDAIQCIAKLNELGSYEFTYALGESLEFAGPWVSDRETVDQLRTYLDTSEWGDIYARLVRPA